MKIFKTNWPYQFTNFCTGCKTFMFTSISYQLLTCSFDTIHTHRNCKKDMFGYGKLTCKKLGPNLNNWMRFWDLKIWQKWNFASSGLTKILVTRSIFVIECSSFGFSLIFVCSKIYILQLAVLLTSFLYPPLKRGRVKNLN